ncbi:uncharacterized protein VTP21DRAFT_7341 [Calcarisporiella thermophila]|uniref:uncharacterized protein n=1 Tax=Calcarisporiella thermophila TaxID=911321 RepID=UPI0037430E73
MRVASEKDGVVRRLREEQLLKNEAAAREFIERTLDIRLNENLQQALKDGTVLCNLVNALRPGTIPPRKAKTMAWEQLDSINLFLKGAQQIGLKSSELFQPPDLFEDKNMVQVVNTLLTLERLVTRNQPISASRRQRSYSQVQLRSNHSYTKEFQHELQANCLSPSPSSSSSSSSSPSSSPPPSGLKNSREASNDAENQSRQPYKNRRRLISFRHKELFGLSTPRKSQTMTEIETEASKEEPSTPAKQLQKANTPKSAPPPHRISQVGALPTELADVLANTRHKNTAPREVLRLYSENGKLLSQYQIGNCIGRGQFGAVYRALNLGTGQMVAVKRIKLDKDNEDQIDSVMQEIELLQTLSHPSIVRYEGFIKSGGYLNLILEYAENGSLLNVLKAFGNLPERLVASYSARILDGLIYLHEKQVVHCDLKAANLLTTKYGNVKVADFGVSLNMKLRHTEGDKMAGTPYWMAPEIIELRGASPKSDIWAFGCTIVELITGSPPYSDMSPLSAMYRIVEDPNPPIPTSVSNELRDFLLKCFQKDPVNRPTAKELLQHAWIKKHWDPKTLSRNESLSYSENFRRKQVDTSTTTLPEFTPTPPRRRCSTSDSPTKELSEKPKTPSPMRHSADLSAATACLSLNSNTLQEHRLVKTSFDKLIECKICKQLMKKHAVLCEVCGLICHERCIAGQECQHRTTITQAALPSTISDSAIMLSSSERLPSKTHTRSVTKMQSSLEEPPSFSIYTGDGLESKERRRRRLRRRERTKSEGKDCSFQ